MQFFELLSRPQLEQIHEATLHILKDVGVDFHFPPALDVLAKGGARVEGNRVFFSPKMVEEQIRKAPSSFTIYARDPKKNVIIGGDNMAFVPAYGSPFVTSFEGGRRLGLLADYENFVKLTHASPHQDICSGTVVEPNDVPHQIRHLQMLYTTIKNSDKCFMGSAMGTEGARDSLKMAGILFGDAAALAEKPRMISILCSLTPLTYESRMLGAIMEYARAGQPQLISSLAIIGVTAPVTLAGALALQNAEILAGIVLTQLIREGTPVVFSGSSSSAEMRSGALSAGSPEMAINAAATAQMARFYNIPVRAGGAVSDAKVPDVQAAQESMMNLLTAHVSGVHFVLHAAGILESYNCISYEKFVIDDEACGAVRHMKKGVAVNPQSLAGQLIKDVGPGGQFLDKDHTLRHFRSALFQPVLANRDNFHNWQEKGAVHMAETARRRCEEMIAGHVPPDLPADIDRDLRKLLQQR